MPPVECSLPWGTGKDDGPECPQVREQIVAPIVHAQRAARAFTRHPTDGCGSGPEGAVQGGERVPRPLRTAAWACGDRSVAVHQSPREAPARFALFMLMEGENIR